MIDKKRWSRFFEKTFLLTDIGMDITLEMLFFLLTNAKIKFIDYYFY